MTQGVGPVQHLRPFAYRPMGLFFCLYRQNSRGAGLTERHTRKTMARPSKSKELKAIQGTLRPDRDRVPEKRVLDQKELPDPQLDLNPQAQELLKALCIHLNDAGVLWQVDAMMLSMYCKNWALLQAVSNEIEGIDDLIQEFDSGVFQISPALTVFEKLSKTVISMGSKLGLSPADREKLASFARIEKDEVDPYENLKKSSG